jgi:hypothetical protein
MDNFIAKSVRIENEKRLVEQCERRKLVNPESSEFPMQIFPGVTKIIKLPGITKKLKDKFHPGKVVKRTKRGGSSLVIGTRVHRAVRHATDCAENGCTCPKGKKPRRQHKFTKAILKELEKLKLTVIASEVPIGMHTIRLGTKLDLVCKSRESGRLTIVSIKTGNLRNLGNRPMNTPLTDIKATERNKAALQSACELAILRMCHSITKIPYLLVWANMRGGHSAELPSWALDERKQDLILKTIL